MKKFAFLFTAHSLHSFETQRTQSFYSFFLSAERAERKKQHPSGRVLRLCMIPVQCSFRTFFATEWLIVFICPAERGINEKGRSLCVLGVLSEAGGNSLKLKLTIYDVIYFMHSVV